MRSMTGYGKAVITDDNYQLSVELRSVNNRYLEISIRLPREYNSFENQIRNWLKEKLLRGKINVFLSLSYNQEQSESGILDNRQIIKMYEELTRIQNTLKINEPVELRDLLNYYALSENNSIQIEDEHFLKLVKPAIEEALKQLNQMREHEGNFLLEDIKKRLANIEELTQFVKSKAKLNVKLMFDKMVKNVQDLIGGQKLDAVRLEQEIAIISDKVDITEECVRMESHLQLFSATLKTDGEVGKKLTFILQEMLREANTMNSKNSDVEIQHEVLKIKEEIEKIREQAQNLE